MDPITAAATTGVAKGVGSAAAKQMLALLAKRTERLRVAWAVSKAAKAEGILVGWMKLGSWLKAVDVRTAIASGDPEALRESADRLVLEVRPTGAEIEDAGAARIVDLVRDESLRRMAEGDGRVTQTRRLEHAIESNAREQRTLLTAGGDEVGFTGALEKLHPWRGHTARELATHWTAFRPLVITLVGERDRRGLLQQWAPLRQLPWLTRRLRAGAGLHVWPPTTAQRKPLWSSLRRVSTLAPQRLTGGRAPA